MTMTTNDYDGIVRQQISGSYFSYLANSLGDFDNNKKTIVIIPGMLGSKLRISICEYDHLEPGFDTQQYRDIWSINANTYVESYKLALGSDEHDYKDHIIVPDGPIDGEFWGIVKVRPYFNAIKFFKQHGKNCLLFAYDWRKSPTESAKYLSKFLDALANLKGQSRDQITLVAHSQGGLVLKSFLDQTYETGSAWMGKAVSVGTPFYGAAEALHALYFGQGDLNDTQDPEKMPSVVGSWQNTYYLFFPPNQVFDIPSVKAQIGDYPIRDEKTNEFVDPFSDSTFSRFPTWADRNNLNTAAQDLVLIAKAPNPDILDRWFNIRSVGVPTPVGFHWRNIVGRDYAPEVGQGDQSPLVAWRQASGDGTVPDWSAFHAETNVENKITTMSVVTHANLLESSEVQLRINAIVDGHAGHVPLFS